MIKWLIDDGGAFLVVILGVFGLAFIGLARVGDNERRDREIRNVRYHNCIETGGVPITVNVYTKGLGEGDMCVKITEKMEVDEK